MARKIATPPTGQAEAAAAQASESANTQHSSPAPSAAESDLPLGAADEAKIETVITDASGASVTDLAAPVEVALTGQPIDEGAAVGSELPLIGSGPEAGDPSVGGSTDVDAADPGGIGQDNVLTDAVEDATADAGVESLANSNPLVVQIHPLRSYMDAGELRRRGGAAYTAPRRHAEDLVQRKLASFEPLRE